MTLTRSRLIEAIACACHEISRMQDHPTDACSGPPWSDLPEPHRIEQTIEVEIALRNGLPDNAAPSSNAVHEIGLILGLVKDTRKDSLP